MTLDEEYYIWSNEHRAWWGPNNSGYTTDISRAGKYSRDAAVNQSAHGGDGWGSRDIPEEIPVKVQDVEECQRRYEASFK